MRSKLVLVANFLVGSGLLAYILYRYGGGAVGLLAKDISPGFVAAFVGSVTATLFCLTWRWRSLLSLLARSPSLLRMVLFRSAAQTLATLIPSGKLGGDPLRAWLVVRERVDAGSAIASVAVDRTLEVASTAPFSLVFAAILLQRGVPNITEAMVTVLVATVGLFVGIVIAVRRLRRGAGLVTALARNTKLNRFDFVQSRMHVLEDSESDVAKLADDSARIRAAFAKGIVANLLVIAEFFFLLVAFGLPSDPVAIVAAVFATGAAHMLPVPGGIGVLEGAQVWIFSVLGYPADVGLAVGLAARLRELFWMLPGLGYGLARWVSALRVRIRAS